MCGIAGELNFVKQVELSHIKRMTDAIAHRGPDDEGFYCEGGIGLGHRRLSIIDLSESGRNPIWTSDRSMAIVFNGEVYNYKEIRAELKKEGYSFTSDTDTEVVLNSIHCWGVDKAVQKFIGMFAFAVWDLQKRKLLLVRDRAGIKPLFYYQNSENLLFGSELKAIYAHPSYKKDFNKRGLGQYFTLGYTLDKSTVFDNTFRLPAGHYMEVDHNGNIRINCYWSLDNVTRGTFKGSFEDAVNEFESLSENAFAYRLVSDVPVGVFLSGGIDSTYLAAILKKKMDLDLLHITIGFKDKRYDEAPAAKQIALELNLRHVTHYLDAPDAVKALKRFSEVYDEPFGDSSGMPTILLSAIAREHVKVALSADGGDEQFYGYESYTTYLNRYKQVSKIPLGLRRAASSILGKMPYEMILSSYLSKLGESRSNPRMISTFEKALEILNANTPSDIINIMNGKGWLKDKVGHLLGSNLSDIFSDTIFANKLIGNQSHDDTFMMDLMMRADYQSFLRDDILTKVDRASMAASLECRDPFLDHRIAEFAYTLPLDYMYANGEHKRLLRHILRKWISDPILNAPKRGFVVPLYEWMKGPFKPLIREYLSRERILAVGVLDDKVVAAEVDRFYKYNGIGAEKLLLLLNFQIWAERWYFSN
uniref:asparagine synthase (glutamine-hydrolyzing) n=1 Tax=Algoriphagus sp. TaxID=1872435 RepID=UPI004047DEF3